MTMSKDKRPKIEMYDVPQNDEMLNEDYFIDEQPLDESWDFPDTEQYDIVVGITVVDNNNVKYDLIHNEEKLGIGQDGMIRSMYILYNIGLAAKEEADQKEIEKARRIEDARKTILRRIK